MFKALCFALVVFFSCSQMQKVQKPNLSSSIPVLTAFTDTGKLRLKISELHIDVQVAGNIATTTFDIRFYNPLDRVLEGEFEFPLADGQNISSYALEVNDQLREGVVVEKKTARVAFENTARRGIDPGLAEKTKGNNFRTRIYPIPAKGTKRIVIGIEQTMDHVAQGYLYNLPLYAKELIDRFSIHANVLASPSSPLLTNNELAGFNFLPSGNDDFSGKLSREKITLDHLFAFSIPFDKQSNALVLTENYKGQTYFYANTIIDFPRNSIQTPERIAILWDISSSSEKRNPQQEIELLERYITALENVEVELIPFNIKTQTPETFSITNGDASKLIQKIKSFTADGGTQLGAINGASYSADQFLLFSDGLSTFGKKEMLLPAKPVIAINSSASADYSYLKFIAEQTNGKFIDLTKLDVNIAKEEILQQSVNIITAKAINGEVEELVTRTDLTNHTVFIAGILKTRSAAISLQWGYDPEHIVMSKEIMIGKKDKDDYNNVKRIWASMKIDRLDLQFEKNKDAITALGKEFSIVTRNTSLLVLDRVEDYVEYEITPPAELQKEYYTLLKDKNREKDDEKTVAFNEAIEAMKNLKDWWNKKFDPNRKPKVLVGEMEYSTDTARMYNITGAMDSAVSESVVVSNITRQSPPQVETYKFTAPEIKDDEAVRMNGYSSNYIMDGSTLMVTTNRVDQLTGVIQAEEWKPDVEYLRILEKTSSGLRFDKYNELIKKYQHQPSFFVDVAHFFFKQNKKEQALVILSNIAEMKLEEAELLRIMAFRLQEMNETELAIETFKEIMKMREEEPQSYRDLALAYNEAGRFNEAVSLLYKLTTGTWDERFGDVKSIALNELNAIISAHPGKVDLAGIDPRFIYAMPVDVRIVVGWTSDNSDVDLWVTDPNNEKCFYSHSETVIGGKISEDVTQGYGPEEFSLKKAKNGEYVIEANLYGDTRQTIAGPITITADMFTDFGKPSQKRKTINFRVEEHKDVVKIGALRF